MAHALSANPYRAYWIAWLVLLAITLVMLAVGGTAVVAVGITLKAAIIALWFMHLRSERLDFTAYIIVGIFVTGLILGLLLLPDGLARLR